MACGEHTGVIVQIVVGANRLGLAGSTGQDDLAGYSAANRQRGTFIFVGIDAGILKIQPSNLHEYQVFERHSLCQAPDKQAPLKALFLLPLTVLRRVVSDFSSGYPYMRAAAEKADCVLGIGFDVLETA